MKTVTFFETQYSNIGLNLPRGQVLR